MSKINFRAWDKANKRMTTRGIFISSDGTACYDIDVNGVQMSGRITILPTDRFIIMLYTGLLDSRAMDIFEGDLIKNEEGEIFEVVFSAQYKGWAIKSKKKNCSLAHIDTMNYTIIGHIHTF